MDHIRLVEDDGLAVGGRLYGQGLEHVPLGAVGDDAAGLAGHVGQGNRAAGRDARGIDGSGQRRQDRGQQQDSREPRRAALVQGLGETGRHLVGTQRAESARAM